MKKILALILAFAAVICVFASCGKEEEKTMITEKITVKADDSLTWNEYKYVVLEDGTAKIVGYLGKEEVAELSLPDFINEEIKVSVIGSGAFKDCNTISYVNMPKFVTKIEKDAFAGSTLKNAMLLSSHKLEKIDAGAFENCKSLVQVDLSSTIKEIGDKAFSGDDKLVVVTFRGDVEKISDTAFENTRGFKITTFGEFKNVVQFAEKSGYTLENIG